jgi:FAD/FMN-containing dehydrogenase
MLVCSPSPVCPSAYGGDAVVLFCGDRLIGLRVTAGGARHNTAGNSLADGDFLIDLSLMTAVYVESEAKTARGETPRPIGRPN